MEVKPSNNNFKSVISVPGKALLFGEYGVMQGGSAVAVSLPQYRMDVEFSFMRSEGEIKHSLESDYFPQPVTILHDQIAMHLNSNQDSEERNLACYLSSYVNKLDRCCVQAEVTRSFSPSLGFGSSSALLSAFGIALYQRWSVKSAEEILEDKTFWQNLFDSLVMLQRRGSGYDIALQSWCSIRETAQCKSGAFAFRNVAYEPRCTPQQFEPLISRLQIPEEEYQSLGCFVETGVRSETRIVLRDMENKYGISDFCEKQSAIASLFIENPCLKTAQTLCREASDLSKAMGLLPTNLKLNHFVNECDKYGISWKTMGAGFGDCLWVLAERSCIESLAKRIDASELKVRFAFEDC